MPLLPAMRGPKSAVVSVAASVTAGTIIPAALTCIKEANPGGGIMASDERAADREDRARDYSELEIRSRRTAAELRKLLSQTTFTPGPAQSRGLRHS